MFSWLPFGALRASSAAREEALEGSKIESLQNPRDAVTMIAGNKQTKGALPVQSPLFDAAIYSSRGRGYARYNEDSAELFTDAQGYMYAGVFDQAGGLGGKVRGQASEVAAQRLFQGFRKIATSPNPIKVDIPQILYDEMMMAHHQLVQRGQGEVTTAVAAVAFPGIITVVNSGDSGALHFDGHGNFKLRTEFHEHESPMYSGCLTHALGLVPEDAAPDAYEWELEPGDWVILCSDGLLDAGLSEEEVGKTLQASENAEDALNKLCKKVLRMMVTFKAKPDNLTVVAIRALG